MILPEPRDRFRGRLPKRWVAIDFETTGIWSRDPDVAVIEIGLITFEGDREIAAWSTLVKSGTPVSDFIADLTGITQAMVDAEGIDVDEAGDALAERLAGAELVIAHNMAFDINGLDWLGIELGRDQHTFCTMKGLTAPDQKWPRLEEVVAEFRIKVEGPAHRAESDALLDMLYRHSETPEFQCRFVWQPNSIAFWDNRAAMHHAMWDYFPHKRLGYRVTVKGDKPFYRA